MRPKKILVACEYSGKVRDAFIKAGHNAVSCDLLPSESSFGPHIQGDVTPLLGEEWDLVVAHPECTYLCNSGVRWLETEPGRFAKMCKLLIFSFIALTPTQKQSVSKIPFLTVTLW